MLAGHNRSRAVRDCFLSERHLDETSCIPQVAEVQELRGTTSRQDVEVRHLREENRDLAQKAALAEVLTADCSFLKKQARVLLHKPLPCVLMVACICCSWSVVFSTSVQVKRSFLAILNKRPADVVQ